MPDTAAANRPPEERRVVTGDGVGLAVSAWPDPGSGERPFLLVHGLASNRRTWEAVAGHLAAAGHPVATVDLRGHGGSDKPDDGYDFATLCADLRQVLAALGFDHAVVAGQSTGGNLAVELARGGGLAGVAGIDGGVIELARRWPSWDDCAAALAPPRWDGVSDEEFRARLRRSHPSWDDWGIDATMANFAVGAGGALRPHLARQRHLRILRSLWEHRPSSFLAEVEVPVLLVLAGPDQAGGAVHRREAEGAAALLPRGRLHWVEGADHDVHVQHPATVAGLLRAAVADGWLAG